MPYLSVSCILKVAPTGASETSVPMYQNTWRYIPQDSTLIVTIVEASTLSYLHFVRDMEAVALLVSVRTQTVCTNFKIDLKG